MFCDTCQCHLAQCECGEVERAGEEESERALAPAMPEEEEYPFDFESSPGWQTPAYFRGFPRGVE